MLSRCTLFRCSVRILPAMCVLLAMGGCAHGPVRALWQTASPLDHDARQALTALSQHQDMLRDLRAQGACIVSSSELVGRRKFNMTMLYIAPGDVAVRGFDPTGLAGQAFRLVAVGQALDVEIPEAGVELAEMLAQIPAESIARELLRPEEWHSFDRRRARVLEQDMTGGAESMTMLINKRFGFFRRVMLEGPGWVLRSSELIDRNGYVRVRVEWSEYVTVDGVQVPVTFEASFPHEGLSLSFRLTPSRVAPNTGLDRTDLLP